MPLLVHDKLAYFLIIFICIYHFQHDPIKPKPPKDPQMLGVIKIPKGVLVKSGSKKREVVSLNLVLQKGTQKNI